MKLLSIALSCLAAIASALPQQVHLSLTGRAGEMAVDFVTAVPTTPSFVKYGTSPDSLTSMAAAESFVFTQSGTGGWSATMNQASMTGLAAETVYYYSVGNKVEGWTQVFNFTNQPAMTGGPKLAIYADFGLENDECLSDLKASASHGAFDMVIHAGDFAYDLDSKNSATGNSFMAGIEPYAATMPYMASPGNHEAYGTQGGGNFSQFNARFAALGKYAGVNSGSNSSLYYSWEIPGVAHFTAFTAETWTMSAQQIAEQAAWLATDFASVDRTRTPWLVTYAHKYYSMDQVNWDDDFSDLLHNAGVDLHFCGHWHWYGRFYPLTTAGTGHPLQVDNASSSADGKTYTNPKFVTGIVTGAPGDRELNPKTCSLPAEVAHSGSVSCNYGYGILTLPNATHAHWVWKTVVPVSGGVDPKYVDDFWLVQENHGKRATPVLA